MYEVLVEFHLLEWHLAASINGTNICLSEVAYFEERYKEDQITYDKDNNTIAFGEEDVSPISVDNFYSVCGALSWRKNLPLVVKDRYFFLTSI